jgi:type IV secretion/conjugal transfer VirB4 family ATPase
MIGIRRILKDYREAGALQALVPVQSVVGEGVFATKSGDLLMMMRVEGFDFEGLDAPERQAVATRWEAALRILDERFRVYQYLLKRELSALPSEIGRHPIAAEATANRMAFLQDQAGPFYSLETYVAVLYEGWQPAIARTAGLRGWILNPREALRQHLSADSFITSLQRELDVARDLLAQKVAALTAQLRDFMTIEVLDSQRAFRLLRRLVNYAPQKSDTLGLRYESFVDYQSCDSALECHREFLRLDEDYVQVFTLKTPPARTFPNLLAGLAEIPCNAVMVSEWKPADPLKVRRLIQSKRRHFHNVKASALNYLNRSAEAPRDLLIDDGAVALVGTLGACLEDMELHGRAFGQFSLTLVLHHADVTRLRRAAAQSFKIFATQDAQLTEERYNRLNAWLAVLPGNTAYNLRRLWLTSVNHADLSFLFTLKTGDVRNAHLGAEYLAVLEGRGGLPYFLNLHVKDVAHALVLGATGSGKSFFLNFLLAHAQKYAPFTFIFDLGGSYENLTKLFGGSYLSLGRASRGLKINPFALPPTPENLRFLFSFLKVLVGSSATRLNPADEQDLYDQMENLYSIAPDQRRLFTLANIVRRPVRQALQKWVQGGAYGHMFDHADDELTVAQFQTFDFEGMDRSPDELEPLLFYVLHRASAFIEERTEAGRFKVFVVDEAWRFFRHPVIKAYIVEALKTWRKKNAAMLLATQSTDDLLASDLLPTVVESCPTQFFLSNPSVDREAYRRAFHLTETEAAEIAALVPKQEILIKQPGLSKRVRLRDHPAANLLYTSSPQNNVNNCGTFPRRAASPGLETFAKETL